MIVQDYRQKQLEVGNIVELFVKYLKESTKTLSLLKIGNKVVEVG